MKKTFTLSLWRCTLAMGLICFLGLTCDTVLLGTTRVVSAIAYAKSF
jgi:hypothetical protein